MPHLQAKVSYFTVSRVTTLEKSELSEPGLFFTSLSRANSFFFLLILSIFPLINAAKLLMTNSQSVATFLSSMA